MRRNRPHIPRDFLYRPFDEAHPVARAMATGSRWFDAWCFQYSLNGPRLRKLTGIGLERAMELSRGAPIAAAELDALAKACGVQPADIIASFPDPQLLGKD